MSKKVIGAILTGVLAVLGISSLAQAASAVLNVTLGYSYDTTDNDYSGAGVLPSGQYWNLVDTYEQGTIGNGNPGSGGGDSAYNPSYLLYDDGTTTSAITITTGAGAPSNPTYSVNPLLYQGIAIASRYNGTASFTISGVAPNALGYDLVLYSYDGGESYGTFTGPGTTYFTLNGVTKTTDSLADASSPTGGFTEYANYVEYTGIQPDGSGNITFTFDYQPTYHDGPTTDPDDPYDQPDLFAIFNGFQLTTVPEPASLGLLVFGSTMLLRRRR